MPFCSVIIPTYNRASFLKEAVESVLEQTYKDYELIIVDDGSTDPTPEMILLYLKKNQLRYFVQANTGVASARNAGIKFAGSEWLAFLDSDDLWQPDKLEKQINFFKENRHLKIGQTEEVWIRNGVRVNPMKKHQKFGGWIFEKCLPLCRVSPSAVMIHQEVFDRIGTFDENLPVCEDYDFWLRTSLNYEIGLLDEPLIIKRGGHEDQLSRKFQVMDRYRIKALEKIINGRAAAGSATAAVLSAEQKKAALTTLQEKCRIVYSGALKRGRLMTALNYWQKLKKYSVLK